MRRLRTAAVAPALLALVTLAACGGGSTGTLPGADASRGQQLIDHYGCGSCHQISGIEQADGLVGPALENYQSSRYITGGLPTTPRNTVRWIMHPQHYEPNTLMPELGVTEAQAKDITAYLYAH